MQSTILDASFFFPKHRIKKVYYICLIIQHLYTMRQTFSILSIFTFSLLSAISAEAQTIQSVEPPIMGWSSWNTYRINISEDLIKRQAEAMVSLGLKDAGYRYINIDDGFFGYRDEKGVLQTHPERFPNGVKGVADHIHRLGLKAGIYSDAGANTCGSLWDADPNGIGVGLYGHEKQDVPDSNSTWTNVNGTLPSAKPFEKYARATSRSTSADGPSPAPGHAIWLVRGASAAIYRPVGVP